MVIRQEFTYTIVREGPGSIVGPDVFLKIFDIRTLRQALPISCPTGAYMAK